MSLDSKLDLTPEERLEETIDGMPPRQLADIAKAAIFAYDEVPPDKITFQEGARRKCCKIFIPMLIAEICRIRGWSGEEASGQNKSRTTKRGRPAKSVRGRKAKTRIVKAPAPAGEGTPPAGGEGSVPSGGA